MKGKLIVAAVLLIAAVAAAGVKGAQAQVPPGPPPLANAGGSYSGIVGVSVSFNGGASAGFNLSFRWNFGDGTQAAGPVVSHVFAAPGSYTAVLTVSDPFGRASSSATSVAIGGAAVVAPSCAATIFGTSCMGTMGVPCVTTYFGTTCGGPAPLCNVLGLLTTFCNAYAPLGPVAYAGYTPVQLASTLPWLPASQLPLALATLSPSQLPVALSALSPSQWVAATAQVAPNCPTWSTNPLCRLLNGQ